MTYNDNNTLKASSIGAAAMSKINAAVLKGVSSTTVGTVVDGVQSLGDGLRTAANGSGQLRDGTSQLRDGANDLADGIVGRLAPGVTAAARGAEKVDDGAQQVSDGLRRLQTGTDELGAGATRLADGIDDLVGTVNLPTVDRTVAQLQKAAPGVDLSKLTALLDGLSQLQSGSRQIATELTDPSAAYRSGVDTLVVGSRTDPSRCFRRAQVVSASSGLRVAIRS
ncbi:hypothetical protein ACFOJ6_09815 [Gordonia humi]|uniref:hypothetical protein n=1 Tax=Gordonia humi TaxID=686429 RepID=UPI00360FB65B